MKGSDYCYGHSNQKKLEETNNTPLYKNTAFQWVTGIAVGVIGIVVAVVLFIAGPSKENQEKMLSAEQHAQKIISGVPENVLKKMREIEQTRYDELKQKYPLGFTLFTINDNHTITPSTSRLLNEYEINWRSAKLIHFDRKTIILKFPDVKDLKHSGGIKGNIVEISNTRGKKLSAFILNEVNGYVEILDTNRQDVIAVIGFKETLQEVFPNGV